MHRESVSCRCAAERSGAEDGVEWERGHTDQSPRFGVDSGSDGEGIACPARVDGLASAITSWHQRKRAIGGSSRHNGPETFLAIAPFGAVTRMPSSAMSTAAGAVVHVPSVHEW